MMIGNGKRPEVFKFTFEFMRFKPRVKNIMLKNLFSEFSQALFFGN